MMETKTCSKCKTEKEFSCFSVDNDKKDGYCSQCKVCKAGCNRVRNAIPKVKAARAEYDRVRRANRTPEEIKAEVETNAAWRQDNKESIAVTKAEYYQNHKQAIAEYLKDNKESIAVTKAEWGENNKESIAVTTAEYYQNNKEVYAKARADRTPEEIEAEVKRAAEWRRNNRGKCNAYTNAYQLAKKQRTVIPSQLPTIQEFYINCPEGYHIDHVYPIKGRDGSCGLHVIANLQILTASDNLKKNTKPPTGEWEPKLKNRCDVYFDMLCT